MKLLVKVLEKLFGSRYREDEAPPDMYLPNRLLSMSVVMLGIGLVLAVLAFLNFNAYMVAGAVICIPLGIVAYLCWKNQSIRVVTSGQFEYTTFLGNTYTYNFSDITGLRKNQDSLTVFVAGKKVHIEAMAYISERLANAINTALKTKTDN